MSSCKGNTLAAPFYDESSWFYVNPNDGKWVYQKEADGTYSLIQVLHTDLGIVAKLGGGPGTLADNVNGMVTFAGKH